MRTLTLSKSGINKVRSHSKELKASDIQDSIKSIPPGEWCIFQMANEGWIGFINPQIDERYTCTYLLKKVEDQTELLAETFISLRLKEAWEKRLLFSGYEKGARAFYGMADGLPGLIIDVYDNASIIQINTAGLDRYRDHIKKAIEALTNVKGYFLDNKKYREKEFLPTYEVEDYPELFVVENDLKYKIRTEVLQKVGFYYDHRENRRQLMEILQRMSAPGKKAVDLFCYAGAWGMSALKAGAAYVDFVDQGDFQVEVQEALSLNGFPEKGSFHRADVFKFLDEAHAQKKLFDIILCDPPAFAKSLSQRTQALEGYSKLHRKVFRGAATNSLCAFSSCTHYVSHEDFQKNIMEAARKEGRKIQLLFTGMQGWDHPIQSLDDKSNYIKSYFYLVE